MTTRVSAVEARRNLGKFLNVVSLTHDDVVIERAGKAIARLSAYEDHPSPVPRGKLDLRNIRGLGKELWSREDADSYVEQERKAWD